MAKTLVLDPNNLSPGIITKFSNTGSAGGEFLCTGTGAIRPICYEGGCNSINRALQFNGVDQFMPTTLVGTNIVAANAFTILAVVFIGSIATNGANPFDNDAILVGVSEYWGMHLDSVPELVSFVFTGGVAKKAVIGTTLNQWVLLQSRLSSGNLYARSGSAGESAPTVCGNIQDRTGTLRLGRSYSTQYGMFKLGYLEVYNTGDADGDLVNARARLKRKYNVAA